VRAVRSAKGVAAEDIGELGHGFTERFRRALVRLDLVAVLVNALAFLLNMEAAVLEKDDTA